jgi:OOP family OmpA-OmpF porin
MHMKSRLNQVIFATAVALGSAGAAQAAEGFYAGGALGTPDYHSSIAGISGDGSGVGGKLFGGYQFTPNFAVEAGAFDLGHLDGATGHVKTYGGYLDAVGSYEFAPKWSVLGTAGLAQAKFSTSNGDDDSPGVKLGAGLQYDVAHNVAVRAQYDRYRFSDAFDTKPTVGEFSLGVKVGV